MKYFSLLFAHSPFLPLRSPPMKPRFSLLAAAAVSFVLCAPASAATHTNLFENFTNFDAEWDANTAASKILNGATEETAITGTDVSGWTGTGLVFQSPSSIRLGNSTTKGVVFSPVIRLSDKAITAGSATLSFHAARTAGGTTAVTRSPIVTVLNEDGSSVDGIATYSPGKLVDASSMDSLDSCYTNESGTVIQNIYTGLPRTFRLRFESSNAKDGRVAIDAILVVQDIRDTLSAPAIVPSGNAGANDFAVTWSFVANAEGYSVKLLDANDGVVSSNDVAAATTSASFTGLVSSSEYMVVVVALGNHTTTDNSAPATLSVTTAASSAAAPTLVVANTSWTAGVAGTSAVSATLEGNVACAFESVTMSDGSTATVANGVLSWTPPVANVASSVTATFHVSHGGDSWYVDQVLSVAATPAPGAPSVTLSGATPRSFDASWSTTAGGPIVEYKVRAWTGRATPDDATGSATEMFTNWYNQDLTLPSGWSKEGNLARYAVIASPVSFNESNQSLTSTVFPGTIERISFVARRYSATENNPSTLSVYASSGADGADWTLIRSIDLYTEIGTSGTDFSIALDPGFHQFKFSYQKDAGNCGFGTFSISGTDWPAADFLEGWGGAKVSVGTETSQRFTNPVAGSVNYVEVTAVGPTGLSTSTIASVAVPGRPSVISVQ